jgi:polysaccharide pyruvyl transferase WcaK-like protein
MQIGLLDHMGYGNLGDAATQDALIAGIRLRVPEAQIIGFSLNPADTEKRHGILSYSITHWHPGLNKSESAVGTDTSSGTGLRLKSFLKRVPVVSPSLRWIQNLVREILHLRRSYSKVRRLDCLAIAGGGQLCELWRGPWSHPYNVFKFSLLAKLARKKLLIVNVGAGPIESRLAKAFIKWSVQMADYVSFRDNESQALVNHLDIRRATFVFPDSAYALDALHYVGSGTSAASRPVVGINPIGVCDPRIWPRQDSALYSRYLDNLAEVLVWLSRQNYEFKIFSAERSVDLYAVEDLKQRLESKLPDKDLLQVCAPPLETVESLMTEMAGFDFVITSKFHGVVFSHLLAKPVVAISYHPKIDHLMQMVEHGKYCLNIESFDSTLLRKAFSELVENGPALKMKYREIVATRATSLNGQFDDLFVPEYLGFHSQVQGTAISGIGNSEPEWKKSAAALEESER